MSSSNCMPQSCCCCTVDEEHQKLGCVLFHYQCGCFPFKCCDYDNDGMCWGCVCCECQIDPCFLPRNLTKLVCACIPCGCIAQETIFFVCCCNPGKETVDPNNVPKNTK